MLKQSVIRRNLFVFKIQYPEKFRGFQKTQTWCGYLENPVNFYYSFNKAVTLTCLSDKKWLTYSKVPFLETSLFPKCNINYDTEIILNFFRETHVSAKQDMTYLSECSIL